jgi:hypothetical protein
MEVTIATSGTSNTTKPTIQRRQIKKGELGFIPAALQQVPKQTRTDDSQKSRKIEMLRYIAKNQSSKNDVVNKGTGGNKQSSSKNTSVSKTATATVDEEYDSFMQSINKITRGVK